MHPAEQQPDDLQAKIDAQEYEVLKRYARIQEALEKTTVSMEEFSDIIAAHNEALIELKKLRDQRSDDT